MSELLDRARAWLEQDPDPETRAELQALIDAGDEAALGERFAGRLQFGTAGIRGVLGAGPMRMNRLVVREVSAGLADYVLAEIDGARERGVVIGHDARKNSRLFAEDAARVFAGKGLPVRLFEQVVPTPVTAFAVLETNAAAGVMVTASHNPPDYNGYKVYWDNGAQIIPPIDTGIAAAIAAVGRIADLAMPELDALRADGVVTSLGAEMEQRYLAGVRGLAVHPDAADKAPLTIAYTAMHGVGARFVDAAMKAAGFTDFHSEPSQNDPDGAFPTVAFPNPEEDGAMDRVLELARAEKADLVLANDPDADRLAVAVPDPAADGGYQMLTGDQIGQLLADYLMVEGPKDERRMVATTIVSSQLLGEMAASLGVSFEPTLTGFKWIANAGLRFTRETGGRFVMGYEEALGYTVGELVRDKDGVSAAVTFAELTSVAKARGQTVLDVMDSIYRRYGLYLTEPVSLMLPGAEGLAKIAAAMESFRDQPPAEVAGFAVRERHDLQAGALGLPKGNVLLFFLDGGRRIIMRPSGTEPKLKSYYEVREPVADGEDVGDALERARASLAALRDAHQAMVADRMG
jgi:phosphomannomutase